MFTLPGVKVFFSQRLCQDPLEKFFGCQRQRGGTHENPNVQEFCKNSQALRVVNSFCHDVVKGKRKGNCRGGMKELEVDKENLPLAKRRRVRK